VPWLKGISWNIDVLSFLLEILLAAELLVNRLAQEVSELIFSSKFLLLWSLVKLKACSNVDLVGANWGFLKL